MYKLGDKVQLHKNVAQQGGANQRPLFGVVVHKRTKQYISVYWVMKNNTTFFEKDVHIKVLEHYPNLFTRISRWIKREKILQTEDILKDFR